MAMKKEWPWGSIHSSGGWEAQLARCHRWKIRLMNTKEPVDVLDYLFTLFQNCHHIKDWLLKNQFSKNDVKAFIESHEELRVCRDVCNMTKHFSLDHRGAQEYEPSILREYEPIKHLATFESDSRLIIVTAGKNLDARLTAYRCVDLWQDFLSSNLSINK